MSTSFTLIAIIFVVIFLAMMASMGYLMYWVIKKSTEKKSDEFVLKEKRMMHNWVEKKKSELIPWDGHNFTDIGSRIKYSYSKTTKRKFFGTMLNKDNKRIIAFYRLERGFGENGYMFASSTNFDLYFEYANQSYQIGYNNKLLGTITKSGDILDANNQVIGFAKHPIKWNVNVPFYSHRGGDNSYEFKINNSLLAMIEVSPKIDNPTVQEFAFSNENLGAQFIRLVDKNYSQEEEQWLIAMAVLEGAIHGYWFV